MSGTRVRDARPAKAVKGSKAARPTVDPRTSSLIGAPPRVDLLPPEVHDRRRMASVRSTMILLAVLAVVVVGGGFAFATLLASQSQAALETEQQRTLDLLSEQQQFIEVRQVQARVTASEAAERVGTSTEIDWQAVVLQVAAAMPPGTLIQNIKADAATPILAYSQSTVPLEGARLAGMQVGVQTNTVPDVAALMDGVRASVVGVTDVVYLDTIEAGGIFNGSFMIYFNADVLVATQLAALETEETE